MKYEKSSSWQVRGSWVSPLGCISSGVRNQIGSKAAVHVVKGTTFAYFFSMISALNQHDFSFEPASNQLQFSSKPASGKHSGSIK